MSNEIEERKDTEDGGDKREILFRGKTIQGGFWKEGCLLYWANQAQIWERDEDGMTHNYSVDPKTVGQYTGFKDDHGKKIYEGDIVKILGEGGGDCVEDYYIYGEVEWLDNIGLWYFTGVHDSYDNIIRTYDIEVVGNISDNPELLEQGNE